MTTLSIIFLKLLNGFMIGSSTLVATLPRALVGAVFTKRPANLLRRCVPSLLRLLLPRRRYCSFSIQKLLS